jgi:hypothetical protein
MHAVVLTVKIDADEQESQQHLREQIVPRVKEAPGFVAGYWVRLSGDKGTSVVVFESEDAARSALEQGPEPPSGVTIDSSEIGEVVASA